jgi:phosphoadenosine phosphosulfate reductase
MMQITFEGKTLDQLAIELIQAYSNPSQPFYVGYSGGVDSEVTLHLVKRSSVPYDAHYNVSPIDPPQVRWFIKEWHPEVIWDYHARGFFKHVLSQGLPMRPPVGHRWCCKLIKEAGGVGRVKVLGMRRDESNTRRNYKCFDEKLHQGKDTFWLLPILNWTRNDVWQYISEHNLPFSALYRNGFKRIGCVLCPYHGKAETKLELELFPKIAQAWRSASDRYFYKRIERGTPLPYETPEEFWQWWLKRS